MLSALIPSFTATLISPTFWVPSVVVAVIVTSFPASVLETAVITASLSPVAVTFTLLESLDVHVTFALETVSLPDPAATFAVNAFLSVVAISTVVEIGPFSSSMETPVAS